MAGWRDGGMAGWRDGGMAVAAPELLAKRIKMLEPITKYQKSVIIKFCALAVVAIGLTFTLGVDVLLTDFDFNWSLFFSYNHFWEWLKDT